MQYLQQSRMKFSIISSVQPLSPQLNINSTILGSGAQTSASLALKSPSKTNSEIGKANFWNSSAIKKKVKRYQYKCTLNINIPVYTKVMHFLYYYIFYSLWLLAFMYIVDLCCQNNIINYNLNNNNLSKISFLLCPKGVC